MGKRMLAKVNTQKKSCHYMLSHYREFKEARFHGSCVIFFYCIFIVLHRFCAENKEVILNLIQQAIHSYLDSLS